MQKSEYTEYKTLINTRSQVRILVLVLSDFSQILKYSYSFPRVHRVHEYKYSASTKLAPALLQFPNLQVLELHCYSEPCRFSSESCPNLKAIYLGAFFVGFPVLIKGLPASLEKIWLSWSSLDLESDLQALDSSLPHLEDLRFENKFGSDSKILGFIRARRSAAEQGAEVGGIKMKPIKKLTVRRGKFSNEVWLALEGLVEELVDLKDAPNVEEISI